MPTGNRNGKSVKLWARVPLDLANDINELKEDGESVTAFLIQALRAEAEHRKEGKKRSGVSGWA
ncbi:YlcI/YnfO family protein [Trabulsiella guamensis]|uniref:YlcI/YnfO family protein n=1 Tax=Trabulsiella guamensis TaxID=158852 RepID=UPI0005717FEB|nr:YlcI/YnfO family protein [Trabulsiella guamensis]